MVDLLTAMDFGNEAADDVEPAELISYFVEQPSFGRFINPQNKILVTTARKGVGKSALLQWVAHKVPQDDPDALVIKCHGADLVRSKFNLSTQLSMPNDYIRDWMIRLCALVNRRLALNLNIALTDDRITLVETAELDGYKSRNLVGCLLDRLQSLIDKGVTKKLPAKDEVQLLKRVKDKQVWIIVDDLDATYQNTNQESLDLATFFSACRYLARDMKDICFRVSMRTDVWALIRRYDESLDKTEQYVHEILWHERDFLKMLYLRVKTQLDSLGIHIKRPPAHVHDEDAEERLLEHLFVPKMDWGDKQVDTYKVIYTLSYERPRWAVQLCKLAKESAIRHRDELISKTHIDEVWGEYGAKRIADLVAEHKHQCPQVEELLNAFRGADRLMTRDELFRWINNRVVTHVAPRIEGEVARSPMDIARFLYRLGFILARSDAEDESYEHYRFDQMPDFLSARTDDDFGLKWEIHPCYREALDIKKLDWSHRERFGRLRGKRY